MDDVERPPSHRRLPALSDRHGPAPKPTKGPTVHWRDEEASPLRNPQKNGHSRRSFLQAPYSGDRHGGHKSRNMMNDLSLDGAMTADAGSSEEDDDHCPRAQGLPPGDGRTNQRGTSLSAARSHHGSAKPSAPVPKRTSSRGKITDEFSRLQSPNQFEVRTPKIVKTSSSAKRSTARGMSLAGGGSYPSPVRTNGSGQHCRMGDLSPTSKSLSSRSNKLFRVLLANSDAFPEGCKGSQWARKAFKAACLDMGMGERYYKGRFLRDSTYSRQIQEIIMQREAQLRGEVKTVAAELLLEHYKLPLSRGQEAIADAIEQFTADSLFVYADHWSVSPQKIFEHPMIQAVYTNAFFKDRRSDGVVFQTVFAEGQPSLLALIVTSIHCALEQWSSGEKRSGTAHKFTAQVWKPIYQDHLDNVTEFARSFPNKYKRIMRGLFTNAIWHGGPARRISGLLFTFIKLAAN
ncbi:hypothetical protein CALCODRAFT_537054 [Calocera cornea HHB12733]|uniref:DUF6532 domain-containing protein n=1 Tax=Calocera cornea HHB12733 TaxID=1353952 RepID=A0A165HFB0_9BASI|nr:hypothetical protein CALCODRAFT_537054 [Calocera cornea HHB12733]